MRQQSGLEGWFLAGQILGRVYQQKRVVPARELDVLLYRLGGPSGIATLVAGSIATLVTVHMAALIAVCLAIGVALSILVIAHPVQGTTNAHHHQEHNKIQ